MQYDTTATGRTGSWIHWLRSRLTVNSVGVAGIWLVIIVIALLAGPQSDTWWQLRTGQWILEHRSIPIDDPFSWTVRGGPWPNHEWLAVIAMYLVYTIGGLPLLALGCAAVTVAAWFGISRLCEGPAHVRALAVLGGVVAQQTVWSIRPHMLSLALLSLVLVLIPNRRWHWCYPLVFVLWANTHAAVAFGGVVLVVACAVAAVINRRDLGHWLAICAASAAATLINPLGIGLWFYIVGAFNDPTRTYLQEWQPPKLDWPLAYPFFVLALLWLAAVLWSRRSWRGQRDWTLLIVAVLFLGLGLRSIRHTAMFAIVAVPLLTRACAQLPELAAPPARTRRLYTATLAVLVLGAALVVQQRWVVLFAPPLPPAFVSAVRTCPGPLFNTYNAGGPLIWYAPDVPVFIDNRQDPYPSTLLIEASQVEQSGTYQPFFSRYQIACAIVRAGAPIESALQRDGWRERGRTSEYALFAR